MTLQIGYAQQTITPSLDKPVYLAGFGNNRLALSIHDDLYVRALAVGQHNTRLVLVALDLLGLGRQHCQAIEQRLKARLPGLKLIIASTHTHHGPDTIGFWGPDRTQSGLDPAYMSRLKEKIEETILSALAKLQPASMRWASTQVTGVAKNARDPEVLDEELSCIQFCHPETAAPLATWLIYPCHPEVLWDDNPHITADYICAMRQTVEAESNAPCLAMVGALGGMMTPNMAGHTFVEAHKMGAILGQAALKLLATKAATAVEQIEYKRCEYNLPLSNPLFKGAIETGLIANFLHRDGRFTTEAGLLKLGPAWFFSVPGELLPKLGLAYKAMLKEAGAGLSAIIGLANDELGYILPADEFVYPADPFESDEHYEESMSVGIEAGPRLTAALEALCGA